MDSEKLFNALSTLYLGTSSIDAINAAQQYVNEIINNNSIVVDLQSGLQNGDGNLIFGLCNIIYQQTQIFRRTPNLQALSNYSTYLSNYLISLTQNQIAFPNSLTFNRICLCYAVLQTFDTNALKTLVLDCFQFMQQSPNQLRVYLTIYRNLLEEVDSNHLPEYVKDQVVAILIESKSQWMDLFYKLLQTDISIECMSNIVLCMNYSMVCCSLSDLYAFPNEQCYETNFLSLLLQLLTTHCHTPLFHNIITFLITLLETIGYPVHRLVKPSIELIYPTLLLLCGQMMNNQYDEDINHDIIQLLHTIIMQYPSILEIHDVMNIDILNILLFITSLPNLNMASLTMDAWLFIVERPSFYKASTPNNKLFYCLLLDILRDKLISHEVESISYSSLFSQFAQEENQFQLVKNIEFLLNWKPLYADNRKAEIFPLLLEAETTPFRHGPPGCEDVIRSVFFQTPSTVLQYLLQVISTETKLSCLEADVYMLNQCIEDINSNKEDYKLDESFIHTIIQCIQVVISKIQISPDSYYYIRQTVFFILRILQMKTVWNHDIISTISSLALQLLQCHEYSTYGADILLYLISFYNEDIKNDYLLSILMKCYTDLSTIPYTRVKLGKIIPSLYKNVSPKEQVSILTSLINTTFSNTSSLSLSQQCILVYQCIAILNTSWQLYQFLEMEPSFQTFVETIVQNIISFLVSLTTDCQTPSSSSSSSQESESMCCFCHFLLNCLRGCYVNAFSSYINTIMNILIAYFQKYYQSSLLIKTILTLTNFYAKDYPTDFFQVLKHITQIALANSQYNNDEYVKELFSLFSTLPCVCSQQFNEDSECIQNVLRLCEVYLHTASFTGKSTCFRFLNRLLQLEDNNNNVFSLINQVSSQFLQLVICECIKWERPVLRLSASFIFHLVMAIIPQSQERSRTIVNMIAIQYPEVFSQEELAKINDLFAIRLTKYLDLSQFIIVYTDVIGIINNTNTKDCLLAYEMVFIVCY